MSNLTNNTTTIQNLINKINSLPEAGSGGVELPTLNNEGVAADLLINKELIDSTGSKVTGTMPNNGSMTKTIDGINTKSVTIPKGYTSGGTVSLDNTIDNEVTEQTDLITQIISALDGKAAGGGSGGVETCYCVIGCDAPTMDGCTVTYTDADMQLATRDFELMSGTRIEVVKGTIIALTPWSGTSNCSGDCTEIFKGAFGGAYFINGDSNVLYG